MYGYYSAIAASRNGYAVYRDENSKEVIVTIATDTPPDKIGEEYLFSDTRFIGVVTEWVWSSPELRKRHPPSTPSRIYRGRDIRF